MLRLAILPAILGLSVIAVTAASWPPSQTAGDQGSTIITVDFRALTRDGTPILDLKSQEVTLKVGGRPREIVALELIQVAGGPDARSKPPVAAPAAPFVTNAPPPGGGRDVTIVLDEEGIVPGTEKPVRDALANLVASLSPADRVGWLVPSSPTTRVQLTGRHETVRAAIAGFTGRAPRGETAADAACRTRTNLYTLLGVLENVVPSVPSIVVFVSNGFTPPTTIEPVARGGGPAGPCEIRTRDLETLATAAVASHAHVFGIQVIDNVLSGVSGSLDMTGGFEHIAGLSGNAVVRLIGDSLPAAKRIATETSAYYVAAFEVPAQERDGSTERVEVSVARPGVAVRAQPTLVTPKVAVRGAKDDSVKVRDMLTVSKVFRDLPLRATVYTSSASQDGRLRVVCVFEPSDESMRLTDAAVALFDDKGTARAQWTGRGSDLKATPVIVPLNAPAPGTYRMRVAAKDASGAGGTVDHDIKVDRPTKGAVSLGALLLGTQTPAGFTPRLQFVSESVAIAAVEIYGAPKTATVAAVFELAGSETGPALAVRPGTVQAMRDDLRMASMMFPIGPMPPGDVVVRAVVSVDGQAIDVRPARTLRKIQR